jgi:pathogenesis-related protein 1
MQKKLMALLLLGCFGISGFANAGLTTTQKTQLLSVHNQWRKLVGIPLLQWSATVATSAQNWANTLKATRNCGLAHNANSPYGENLFWASALTYSNGTSTLQTITPANVVNSWGSEKQYYSLLNGCAVGHSCGHYTQVVWRNTKTIGCGRAICADKSQVWVCQYNLPGNIIGQKPY